MAGNSSAPTLRYSCPAGGVPDPRALCEALREALAETAPNHRLSEVPALSADAPAPDGLSLSLHLDRVSAQGLTAHLVWQRAGTAAPVTGPEISLGVSDAPLAPQMYLRFTRALLKASGLPL